MAICGVTLIGESINDSVPGTRKLMEAEDLPGLQELARMQVQGGAAALDVNVGRRGPDYMQRVIRAVQEVVSVPLAVDSPDLEVLKAGLTAYDCERAGGTAIVNSIAADRLEGLALREQWPCRVILLITERRCGTECKPCRTAEEAYETARLLFEEARTHGFEPHEIFFDPGIMPVGADTEGRTKRTFETLKLIHQDALLEGCHVSVGLSNFTVMLPRKRPDGRPIRSSLESAFLTLAVPLGLDTLIGSVKRRYELLPEDDPAVICLTEMLELEGVEAVARLDRYLRGSDA